MLGAWSFPPLSPSLTVPALTYMSIRDEIRARVSEGRLVLLSPALPGATIVRTMYVSPEVRSLLVGPWADPAHEERCGRLRADLDMFIEGRLISVARDSRRGRKAYMARLEPARDEVWEIRSRDPSPGIRVLGRFSEVDAFVALTWGERSTLGKASSLEWRRAIEGCKADWRALFPTYPAHSGAEVHDYLSADVFLV